MVLYLSTIKACVICDASSLHCVKFSPIGLILLFFLIIFFFNQFFFSNRSNMLYGNECWAVKCHQEHKLSVAKMSGTKKAKAIN